MNKSLGLTFYGPLCMCHVVFIMHADARFSATCSSFFLFLLVFNVIFLRSSLEWSVSTKHRRKETIFALLEDSHFSCLRMWLRLELGCFILDRITFCSYFIFSRNLVVKGSDRYIGAIDRRKFPRKGLSLFTFSHHLPPIPPVSFPHVHVQSVWSPLPLLCFTCGHHLSMW